MAPCSPHYLVGSWYHFTHAKNWIWRLPARDQSRAILARTSLSATMRWYTAGHFAGELKKRAASSLDALSGKRAESVPQHRRHGL